MESIGIFYGSATGHTRAAALKLAADLGIDTRDVHDVAQTAPSDAGAYDILILGSSTWGDGDLEDDWYDFIAGLSALDLRGKKVALFGCGDTSMRDTFCNAVGILHKRLRDTGATFIGEGFPYQGFDFGESEALDGNGLAYGLLLDDVNHADLTDSRIADWAGVIKASVA